MPAAPASRAAGREVTPVELFRLLPAHFAAVLVCTLLGGILAFAAARLAPRSYQAEAQLYVAAAQEGLTSGYAELQLTADYQELLTSRTMLESVISTLGLSTDTAHLKGQITILHPADTHILRIVAADSSPQRAADIANALAALALDDLSARMCTPPPRLVEQAAARDDHVALGIICANAVLMTRLVGAVAKQLELEAPEVAMLGGLLENETMLRAQFQAEMAKQYPQMACVLPHRDAAAGAVMLAQEML